MTDRSWMSQLAGRFLVFEGPDGSGKTTQYRRLAAACRTAGLTVCEVREPGGTDIGERVREILLDHAHEDMSLLCEMMLYMASRAQLCSQTIRPAMDRGHLVLADRFVQSTLAYQGTAGGIPTRDIEDAARIATGGLQPDLVLLFDVDESTAAKRLSPLLDRMEAKGRAFHRKVRDGYLQQAKDHPDQFVVIDASGNEDEVWERLMTSLAKRAERLTTPAGASG